MDSEGTRTGRTGAAATTGTAARLAGWTSGRRRGLAAAALCVAVAVVAAGCSSGTTTASTTTSTTTSSSSTSTTATTTPAGHLTTAEIQTMQQDLKKVGCYRGAVDGIIGPETTRAVKDFQSASHLTVDGVYGPNTEGLLTAAASAGATTCTSSTPATTAPTTTTTTAAPATTTTGAPATAACTAAAISAALGTGKTLNSYQCGNGWAAGSWTNTMYTAAFLLQSKSGTWVQPPTNACADATALGIPANVLDVSPCKVS